MFQFLQQVDQFGIQQKLQVPPINPTQRSAVGGIFTLALYSASLAYFIYQIIDWQENNKLPKYFSFKKQIEEHKQIQTHEIFAEITNYQLLDEIDPFDPENLIFLPVLQKIPADWSKIQDVQIDFVQEVLNDGEIQNKFLIKNITFVGEPEISKNNQQIDYQVNLQWCNQSNFDTSKFKCAEEATVANYLKQYNQVQISIYLDQFDFKKKELCKTPQIFFMDVIQDVAQYQEYHLQVNSLNIDDGFLFSNSRILEYFTSLSIKEMQYDMSYALKAFGQEALGVLYFSVDQLKEDCVIEYPKISEILADTGSIITFILQVSYFVHKYNEYLCIQKTKKEVIQMYYKDYGEFKIKKNWKGKIISVSKANFIFHMKNIIDFFTELEIVATKKINYLNLQYEVSRLQIFMQRLLSYEQIQHHKKQASSIGQFLQEKVVCQSRTFQINGNQIFPEIDDSKRLTQNQNINIDDLELDFQKTINQLTLNQDSKQEKNLNISNGEIQIINLDSSSIQQ